MDQVLALSVKDDLTRMKIVKPERFDEVSSEISQKMDTQFDQLTADTAEGVSA